MTSWCFIISRASGAPLIANALSFADELVRGGVQKIAKAEFALADKAGWRSSCARSGRLPLRRQPRPR